MLAPKGPTDNPVALAQARRVIDLVQEGVSPAEALKRVPGAPKDLLNRADVQAVLNDLAEYSLAPQVRREAVRSTLNKVLIESAQGTEPIDRKLAIDAAKEIAQDPDVGLRTTQGAVPIDLGALGDLMVEPSSPEEP